VFVFSTNKSVQERQYSPWMKRDTNGLENRKEKEKKGNKVRVEQSDILSRV
jgi:hypothetical protein